MEQFTRSTFGNTMTDIKLTISDRGHKVSVAVGEKVVLSLPENPTTGMRWIMPESDVVDLIADENIQGEPGIGATGLRVLTLQPKRPAKVLLKLLRYRPWESVDAANESFEVELEVH